MHELACSILVRTVFRRMFGLAVCLRHSRGVWVGGEEICNSISHASACRCRHARCHCCREMVFGDQGPAGLQVLPRTKCATNAIGRNHGPSTRKLFVASLDNHARLNHVGLMRRPELGLEQYKLLAMKPCCSKKERIDAGQCVSFMTNPQKPSAPYS